MRELGARNSLRSSLPIDVLQAFDGQRFAGFSHPVRDLLEFGEHRLADDRGADVVDLAIEQIGPLAVFAGVSQQVMAEQLLR